MGSVFMALKTSLHMLLLPPGGPVLLALLGAWLAQRAATATARRCGAVLLVANLALLWLLSTPAVADRLEVAAERCPALDLARPVTAQAIVILSGGGMRAWAPEYGGPAASQELLERVSYGAYLARHTGLPVLVSGNGREVVAMRATLLRNFGVEVRWADDESRDTFQNAAFSARILRAANVTRILLVTSAGHEWRSVQEFTSAGFTVVPAPAGGLSISTYSSVAYYLPNANALERATEALYELLGDVARRFLAASHLRRQAP